MDLLRAMRRSGCVDDCNGVRVGCESYVRHYWASGVRAEDKDVAFESACVRNMD